MRFHVQSPVEGGGIHGVIQNNILAHIPNDVGGKDIDVNLVPIWWMPDFKFKPWDVSKPYVLIDFMEPHGTPEAYKPLYDFVYANPPAIWFVREHTGGIQMVPWITLPIEFPCCLPIPPTVSKEEFDARPITVFFNWGYSHPSRPRFHGNVFHGLADHGIDVISEYGQYREQRDNNAPLWMTIFTPHYTRVAIENLMHYQRKAKVSVSLWGNGKKCFRSGESCIGSIMALPEDNLQWAYPWVHGENCIRLRVGEEYQSLRESLASLELYPIYVAGQETARKYYAPTYARDWVVRNIVERL